MVDDNRSMPIYDPFTALRQGTIFSWLDDHYRQQVDASLTDC